MPRRNSLIHTLPNPIFERVRPHLEPVQVAFGDVLYESGDALRYAYFPVTSIVSLLYELEDGSSAEIAAVGHEGMVGVALITGGNTMPHRAVVRSAGEGYRLKGSILKQEFNRDDVPRRLLLQYLQALLTQISQTAVCNRHHSIDQQLCRWLLLSLDRLPSNELVMTQELISNMLGVRREGITEAAGKLQNAGLIQYSRGRITVQHREGLEERACECYQVVKEEFDRLLPSEDELPVHAHYPPTLRGAGIRQLRL